MNEFQVKLKKKATTSTQAPIAVEDKKKSDVVVEGFVESRVRTLEADRSALRDTKIDRIEQNPHIQQNPALHTVKELVQHQQARAQG